MSKFWEYEVRYTPDSLPRRICRNERHAVQCARQLAERHGMGPYLIYGINEHGETYLGEVD